MGLGARHAGFTCQFLEEHRFAGPAQSQEKLSTDLDRLDSATVFGFLNILRS
jgi:hypothetical protein